MMDQCRGLVDRDGYSSNAEKFRQSRIQRQGILVTHLKNPTDHAKTNASLGSTAYDFSELIHRSILPL